MINVIASIRVKTGRLPAAIESEDTRVKHSACIPSCSLHLCDLIFWRIFTTVNH